MSLVVLKLNVTQHCFSSALKSHLMRIYTCTLNYVDLLVPGTFLKEFKGSF